MVPFDLCSGPFSCCHSAALTTYGTFRDWARIYGWPATVGLKILGARSAAQLVPPSFRRQIIIHGLSKWIAPPKAFSLSSPRIAATFTALSAIARRSHSKAASVRPESGEQIRRSQLRSAVAGDDIAVGSVADR